MTTLINPISPIEEIKEEEEIEFDENDNKIMQLYEVINELIDEQKARSDDLDLLYHGQGTSLLQNVEKRNNSVLMQLFTEMQLKEKNVDDDDDDDDDYDDDDDDSEDEQDQEWEIYNSVVSNLNSYMQQLALFTTSFAEQKELIDLYEKQEDEIRELEQVVEEQTIAIEQQMKRNKDLENALSSVLNEYSNRITVGNKEISSLHNQLTKQNQSHQLQLKQLKFVYDKKISQMNQNNGSKYRQEVQKLIDTLNNSRQEYLKQFEEMTAGMSKQQTNHHREMLTLTQYNQTLTESLAKKTALLQQQNDYKINIKKSLKLCKITLDIDDDDDDNDNDNDDDDYYNQQKIKNRSFTPTGYINNNNNNNNNTALQAKYAKYKSSSSSSSSKDKYTSRNKHRYQSNHR